MARPRLYGETQKRRKKRQTQELKRSGSIRRVQTTREPAPFERRQELNPQDIDFLTAMKEMGVERSAPEAEPPPRLKKFERVRFAGEQEDEALFREAMEALEAQPLGPGASSRPGQQPGHGGFGGRAGRIQRHKSPKDGATAQPIAQADLRAGESAPPEFSGTPHGRTESSAESQGSGVASNADNLPRQNNALQPRNSSVEFRLEEAEAAQLLRVMEEGDFDPAEKYEGAPQPGPVAPSRKIARKFDPDDELDLHGKTSEEAIRLVQSFLLTSHRRGLREVLIITGRGLNSGGRGPVLRDAVLGWLARNGSRFAREYQAAPRAHGGEGAVWVVLK